jgi:hypothetical protein
MKQEPLNLATAWVGNEDQDSRPDLAPKKNGEQKNYGSQKSLREEITSRKFGSGGALVSILWRQGFGVENQEQEKPISSVALKPKTERRTHREPTGAWSLPKLSGRLKTLPRNENLSGNQDLVECSGP